MEDTMNQVTNVKKSIFPVLIIALLAIFAITNIASANDKQDATACKCKISTDVNSFYDKDLIETELKQHDGVKDVYLDLDEKIIYVTFEKSKTNTEKLCKVVNDLGYTSKVIEEPKKS